MNLFHHYLKVMMKSTRIMKKIVRLPELVFKAAIFLFPNAKNTLPLQTADVISANRLSLLMAQKKNVKNASPYMKKKVNAVNKNKFFVTT
ncbi:MAG: hypothetical protein LBF37_04330 [Rickettsiales bacterium]|nr:hypothetical protein [Rickettsiales bacterium]